MMSWLLVKALGLGRVELVDVCPEEGGSVLPVDEVAVGEA